ncbi:MAG: sigma-54-dependent Fis family transcriptional regulator, partial [Treponema sp.]|nr:sigma-54-dependent Fis family transcriptional regulator [Treponema sp.]
GAYTGADKLQKGRFELAHGSTIFLDEIGEINASVQVKLLRVLAEHTFERVGGEKTIEVDVRVIAATNKNMEKEVKEGRFREDLYYRLNVVPVQVPSLRERRDDIPLLLNAYLKKFAEENGKDIVGFDSKTRSILYNYDWPGNIRQLRNCVESAVVMCSSSEITVSDLPPSISGVKESESISLPTNITLDEAEKIIISESLAIHKGNKSKTADALGIGRKTLHRKLQEYGID